MRDNFVKLVSFLFVNIFILFSGIYIANNFGYYNYEGSKKSVLTENAIKRFDRDVKKGKKVKIGNYLEEEKNYNNNLTKLSLGLSNTIEGIFNKMINSIFTEMNKVVKS